MAQVFTTVLGRLDLGAAISGTIGTCPVGRRWVIRDLVIWSGSASSQTVFIFISAGKSWRLAVGAVEPGTTKHLELRQVLNAGESLTADITTSPVHILATGYEFAL